MLPYKNKHTTRVAIVKINATITVFLRTIPLRIRNSGIFNIPSFQLKSTTEGPQKCSAACI
jgi:hypothetical protein